MADRSGARAHDEMRHESAAEETRPRKQNFAIRGIDLQMCVPQNPVEDGR